MIKDKKIAATDISSIGEFGLIQKVTDSFAIQNKTTIKGVGDDAAVFNFTKDTYNLLSTDMLVEGVHFDLAYFPLKHLGYKAVSVNVSDICAMNGQANQITVSIAVSNRLNFDHASLVWVW